MCKTKRWLVVISVVTMLAVASSGTVAAGTPWAQCHSSDPYDLPWLEWVEQEAIEVASILEPVYLGFPCHDWSKARQIYTSLPTSDLWHFAGGCEVGFMSGMALITGDTKRMWGGDIPDLHYQKEFDRMRFAFANANDSCYDTRYYDLFDGFLDNGCEAYLGWIGIIDDYDAYVWATTFYDYAITYGPYVGFARWVTDLITDMPNTPPATTSVLRGDIYVRLIP